MLHTIPSAALALTPALAPKGARLQCFRGLDTHGAMVLATELADWRRFGSAREMIAYVGLVPRERSSGERQRRGPSTKAGNSDVCHVLVHAAWTYWFAPKARSSNICSALHVHGARMPDAASAARGVYTPRRLQASPLFRLVSDLLHGLRRALCAGVRPAPKRRAGGGQVRGLRDPRARGGARRSRRRRGQTPSPRTSARDILPTPRLKFPSRPDSCVTLPRRVCGPDGRLARRAVASH